MKASSKKRVTLKMRTREAYQSKGARGVWRIEQKGRVENELGKMPYRPGVKLDVDRPRLITESYKQTEGQPMILRRARALSHYLDNRSIYILPDELIVGNMAGKPSSLLTFPEKWSRWLDKAIDKEYGGLLSDSERKELHEIHQYWFDKSVHGMERSLLPKEIVNYWFYPNHGAFLWLHGGHTGTPNYDRLFNIGLKGIVEEAREKLDEISSDPNLSLNMRSYVKKKAFYEAVIINTEAVIRQGKRFSELAKEMAVSEKDEKRKNELVELSRICEWVPENPPRTFQEALQFYWFVGLVVKFLDVQTSGTGDRPDQVFYRFYKKDKEAGILTDDQAQELIEHLILKFNEEGQLLPPGQPMAGPVTGRMWTVGGVTRSGADASNELTYLFMDAKNEVGLAQPQIAVRLYKRTPDKLMHKIVESVLKCSGVYTFLNDEMKIPYLQNLNIPLEDARDWAQDMCMRWTIPGKSMTARALGGNFVLPRCLELAFYQGIDKFSGKQVGAKTSDPMTWRSINDVIDSYLEQVRFFEEKLVTIYNMVDVLDEEWLPAPFLSGLLDDCLERGQDCREYKWYPNTIFQPIGHITLANSLAVIKKLVFEEKMVTMAELIDACKNNWEGQEELRQTCINKAPKFGNDDDYVDLLASDVIKKTVQVTRSFKNIYGSSFMDDGTGAASYYDYSALTGATPDGRKDFEFFNDGTISPSIGTDVKGPLATIMSVGKVDHAGTLTHLFNQKYRPEELMKDNGENFIAILRAFVDLGIHHIQFNVVDRETLLKAQENPENYPDLVVRVAGLAAYFIDLAKGVQDQIIARTELQFVL